MQTQILPSSLALFLPVWHDGKYNFLLNDSSPVFHGGEILNNKQLKLPMLMLVLIPSIMIKVAYQIVDVLNTPPIQGFILVFIVFDILYCIVLTLWVYIRDI